MPRRSPDRRSLDPTAGEPRQPVGSRVDYALLRRATLADLRSGRVTHDDVCDAHPYLLRAARHHGEASETRCPVCRHTEPLVHVRYVYGNALGAASGRPLRESQVERVAGSYGPVTVYLVEVCTHCGWNHLVSSHVRGTVQPIEVHVHAGRPGRSDRAAGR